jgi:molecular chaperone DnaJ
LARNHYEVLGVPKTASEKDIKTAFRKLAKKYHPDVAGNDAKAGDRFKEIASAYDVLSDKDKRAKYDAMGRLGAFDFGSGPSSSGSRSTGSRRPGGTTSTSGGGFGGSAGFGTGGLGGEQNFENFQDIFNELFGNQAGRKRSPGTQQQQPPPPPPKAAPARGHDVESTITLPLRDALKGAKPTVEVKTKRACPDCNGTGSAMGKAKGTCPDCHGTGKRSAKGPVPFSRNCERCHGTGKAVLLPCSACDGAGNRDVSEKLRVTIPAGVDDGSRIRVRGKGSAGEAGSEPGDLYLVVKLEADPVFKKDGRNLHSDVRINALNAMLGTSVEVETLEGKANMKVPAGTQGGQKFRLRGKGVPPAKEGEEAGDLYVIIQLDVPTQLDDDSRRLVEQLKTRLGVA